MQAGPQGKKRIVTAALLDRGRPFYTYYGSSLAAGRPDDLYERAVGGKSACEDAASRLWRAKKQLIDHPFGSRDLQGHVLIAKQFVRYPSSLSGAPFCPDVLRQELREWKGRAHIKVNMTAALCSYFQNLFATVERAAKNHSLEPALYLLPTASVEVVLFSPVLWLGFGPRGRSTAG